MRKWQKEKALEFIQTLYQAQSQMKALHKEGTISALLAMLEQCQQSAIEIGSFIENTEGAGGKTVELLEAYCEECYQYYMDISSRADCSPEKSYKRLNRQLIRVENSIKHDIQIRMEAVFLPYKASMWDSMESVWQAAEEDEDCDAYVIPIPYYDKSPDGSLQRAWYEGEQFPEYVPITKYDAYNLEEQHPDLIFIHNPYDNQNFVTSVHPAFYSDKLKQYTDCLVYIPYFVLNEASPDNQAMVDSMKHFCTTSGVINADKVVVQSENMRQIYINVLTEQTGESTRAYWENKISGLGSPKFDKVQKSMGQEQQIPADWLRILKKADGERKKILFYNTSVGALLEHNERMIEKMKEVFRILKKHKDEIALLWRPHPLIQATIESMRPSLWKDYNKLVQEYKAEGWGIYDDTADLNRAIALSDAYYGDWSSVVQLCHKAGVPVMIQNVE